MEEQDFDKARTLMDVALDYISDEGSALVIAHDHIGDQFKLFEVVGDEIDIARTIYDVVAKAYTQGNSADRERAARIVYAIHRVYTALYHSDKIDLKKIIGDYNADEYDDIEDDEDDDTEEAEKKPSKPETTETAPDDKGKDDKEEHTASGVVALNASPEVMEAIGKIVHLAMGCFASDGHCPKKADKNE